MSGTTHGGRLGRPIFLVLASAMVGAMLVAPVAARITGSSPTVGAVTAITYTRSASCAGLSFYPTDSETLYANDGTLRIRVRTSSSVITGTGVFRCDPGLPNGAVVTKVQFTVQQDFDNPGVSCALVRSGLTTTTAESFSQLAAARGPQGTSGVFRLTDTSILDATIDNAKFGYWFECQFTVGSTGRVGVYGANVIYKISSTQG